MGFKKLKKKQLSMKILAFSDIREWGKYEKIVDDIEPDLITLAGDLTSDGFASFWSKAILEIPEFQKELRKNRIKFTLIGGFQFYRWINGKNPKKYKKENILDVVGTIKEKYKNSEEFLKIRKRMHVDKFYRFLRYAGKKSKVLVVKGDHDEDFEGDYVTKKINRIKDCNEISGKYIEIKGIRFLGLGYNETHYLRRVRPLIEEFQNKIDVIITHCEQKRLPLLSSIKPKLIIRGHFGFGKFLVNDIP